MLETHPKIPVMLIGGCTASGKSKLALELAQLYPATIINADSMQVYEELPILTAQPLANERKISPHTLYGILKGNDICSVARWQTFALQEIHRSWKEKRWPIVVGGSGLYLRSLLQGLSSIPFVAPAIREEGRLLFSKWGAAKFYQHLQSIDPLMAKRLLPTDKQRLLRAWEVMQSTRISLAIWQQKLDTSKIKDLNCQMVIIRQPREMVKQQADLRLRTMLQSGAIEEVRSLLNYNYDFDYPIMKALGVSEIRKYLAGELALSETVKRIEISTHQYIKRQDTWFRNQFQHQAVYISSLNKEYFLKHVQTPF